MAYQAKYAKPSHGNPVMRIAFVLLCLVIVSVYMMAGLLAKYRTSGSGGDEARVAKFDVQVTGNGSQGIRWKMDEDYQSGAYTFTVQNQSEVAVRYTVTVEGLEGLGIDCLISPAPADLAPGGEASHTLTFNITDDAAWGVITENMTNDNHTASFPFTVTVDVEQID